MWVERAVDLFSRPCSDRGYPINLCRQSRNFADVGSSGEPTRAAGRSGTHDVSDATDTIRDFVRAQGQVAAGDTHFSDDVDLFDYGYLDSFGIVGLIESVAEIYKVDLSGVDFYEPGKRTIHGIAQLVDDALAKRRTQ